MRVSGSSLVVLLGYVAALLPPEPVRAQDFVPRVDSLQTDVLVVRNGDTLTGEFRGLKRGVVTFKTDAASTVYVKWPRVITATTDKTFEIEMADGTVFVGSLLPGAAAHRLLVEAEGEARDLSRDSVVEMIRIKTTVWERIDGNVNAGFDFTQQESKIDLSFGAALQYNVTRNRFGLNVSAAFTAQDAVDDIRRGAASASYAHDLSRTWFWAAAGGAQSNSQLSLDYAWSIGSGPGRFLVRTNRLSVSAWLGLFFRTERYAGQEPGTKLPLSLTTDFEWFVWAGLSTDMSSRLIVSPILDEQGRWQITFTTSLSRELVSNLYLSIGVTEYFDSRPPGDANRNDFSLTSSVGLSF